MKTAIDDVCAVTRTTASMRYALLWACFIASCGALTIDEAVYKKIDEQEMKDARSVTYTTNWQTREFSVVESVHVTYLKYEFHYSQAFNVFTADRKMAADFTISYGSSGRLLRGVQVEPGNLWRVTVGHLQAANNPELSNAEYVCVGDGTAQHYFLMKQGLFAYSPGLVINRPVQSGF